jgi:hypothetical protein
MRILWMKMRVSGLLILGFWVLFCGFAWPGQASERPEKLLGLMALLPADDEVPGWKRSEKILRASKQEDLYKIFNGGASLYIQHGFRSFVGQSYKGGKGTELEVYIFDQGAPRNTEDLYGNPFTKPTRIKEIANLGEKARIDMTPLFCYEVDFIQKGFFVRVIIQDKSEEGLNAAISFAQSIANRIK